MADTAAPVRDAHSSNTPEAEDALSTAGAALDLLLTEAGLGTRARFLPGRETLRLVTRLARRPAQVVRDRKSTRLNSSHTATSRMPSSA